MEMVIPKMLIVLFFILTLGICDSFIIKTHNYANLSFNTALDGLSYPQYINAVENHNNTISLFFYNFTSQQLRFPPITFNKGFNSTCDFVLASYPYETYSKFPIYFVIGQCSNTSHTQVFNVKVYRSNDFIIVPGGIIAKAPQQSNCNSGPLKVQYYYSPSGFYDSLVYRFCLKKQTTSFSLYKKYQIDAKTAQTFKQDAIQKNIGLNGINLIGIQPAFGPNGIANLYLSVVFGVIVTSGSKLPLPHIVWNIPQRQKVYRVQRLCWSNKFAVLTEGYIYFIQVFFNASQATSINLLRKTDKINLITTANCNFFTIGHNAVCSIYDSQKNTTTWYIYGQTTKKIKTNITQVVQGKNFKPYISEDLCATNSFYQGNARYQLNFNSLQLNEQENKISQNILLFQKNNRLTQRKLNQQFKVHTFADFGSDVFIVLLNEVSETIQQVQIGNYEKTHGNASTIQIFNITKNAIIKIEYQQYSSINRNVFVIITQPLNKNITSIYRYAQIPSLPYFQRVGFYSIPVFISQIGYFKNFGAASAQWYFTAKTSIQKKTYSRLILSTPPNYDLKYRYQIQSQGFKACSIYDTDDQMLFYRQDQDSLVVMRVSFRFRNCLVLDDIIYLNQYKGFTTQCAHDGLFLSNFKTKQIIVLDNNLQVKHEFNLLYDSLKYTKTLLIIQNEAFLQLWTQSTGSLIDVFDWNIEDIVTNIHSSSFFHTKKNAHYQLESILKLQ